MNPQMKSTQRKDSGDLHRVELYFMGKSVIIHRHLLTRNEDVAEAFGKERRFFGAWYTKQEVVITYAEIWAFVRLALRHPFKFHRVIRDAQADEQK